MTESITNSCIHLFINLCVYINPFLFVLCQMLLFPYLNVYMITSLKWVSHSIAPPLFALTSIIDFKLPCWLCTLGYTFLVTIYIIYLVNQCCNPNTCYNLLVFWSLYSSWWFYVLLTRSIFIYLVASTSILNLCFVVLYIFNYSLYTIICSVNLKLVHTSLHSFLVIPLTSMTIFHH